MGGHFPGNRAEAPAPVDALYARGRAPARAPCDSGNGGPAKLATLSGPKGVAFDTAGNAWIADTESHSIRMVDMKTGNLELKIGTGVKGDGPDGDPLKCQLARPHGVFVDKDGSVYVGDSENHRLRVLKK